MKLEHLDFSEDIFEKAVNNLPTLYVVESEKANNLNQLHSEYQKHKQPLQKRSQFITFSELKEWLFAREDIILREEKLSVILYSLLTRREKNRLGIENYNDIIEFSSRFHEFYRQLKEYQIEELPELEGWQKERYELVAGLRQRYEKFLQDQGYSSLILSQKDQEISLKPVESFSRLVFLNTVNLTPLEKNIIKDLDKNFSGEITIYLQLPAADFSAADLEYESLTLPQNLPCELNLYSASEDMLQLVSAFHLARPGCSQLLTPRLDDTEYQHLLSPRKIDMPREEMFSNSQIYIFLELLQKLLGASPPDRDEIALAELQDALTRPFFRQYFQLSPGVLDKVRDLLRKNYLYLDSKLLQDKIPSLQRIMAELAKLEEIKEMGELITYLDDLDLEVLSSSAYWDDIEQFYDALLELKSLENMDLVNSWQTFYDNPALGLIDRVLQYIEYKKITPTFEQSSEQEEYDLELQDLDSATQVCRDHLIIFNASQGWLPSPQTQGFLLTEAQRQQVGLPTREDVREKQRYNFLRHLFSADKAEVLTLKNIEENKSPGAFVEELRLKYDLSLQPAPVSETYYPQFYKSIFSEDMSVETSQAESSDEHNLPLLIGRPDEIVREEPLAIETDDFPGPGKDFSLGYYKYSSLEKCYFHFFCEHLMQLEPELGEIDRMLSPMTFGSMVHFMTEKLMQSSSWQDQEIMAKKAGEVVEEVMEDYHLKIDHRFEDYYYRVVKQELVESLQHFWQSSASPLQSNLFQFQAREVEYSPAGAKSTPFFISRLVNFYLSGRIDLLLDAEDKIALVDFKSGRLQPEQLNFYAILLKHSRGEQRPIHKYFYQVMERKFHQEGPNSELDFRQKMQEVMEDFVQEGKYLKNDSECYRCNYKKVCRVVSE